MQIVDILIFIVFMCGLMWLLTNAYKVIKHIIQHTAQPTEEVVNM